MAFEINIHFVITIPENCQIHVLGVCHQIFSCLPKVHHQLQQELSKVGMNCLRIS